MQLHPLLLIRDSASANKKNMQHYVIVGHEVNKYRIMSGRTVEKDISSSIQESYWASCDTRTKLYDRRDDFNFPIVNFPFTCSNIPVAPVYGIYISQ